MHVKIQIAGVSSLDDSIRLIDLGVEGLGFTLRLPSGIHDDLTEEKAREIIAELPPFVGSVLITYITNPIEAVDFCKYLGVNTIQLHAPVEKGVMTEIKKRLLNIKIIKSINVVDLSAIDDTKTAAEEADAIILDTYDPESGRHGATGLTHDWTISRQIVESCPKPVILAGGLNPDNVAEAIRKVQPWGVDVHTGIENFDGSPNHKKAADFVKNARKGAEQY
ncbi:phosphoribosylanthranilate isomerase [bacterium]|nr:phosphoribosylanthranilate isomerase [bacterium]